MKTHLKLLCFICSVCAMTLVSCTAKKAVVAATSNASETIAASKVIESNNATKKEFKTLLLKADISYQDSNRAQDVTAEIKIKKDEIILVSIRFFGITMAKAIITPKEVKYYEKINGKFFEGDYTTLSRLLGTDLDFFKVQNLMIGQALDNLNKEKYTLSIADGFYKLAVSKENTEKALFIDSSSFLIKRQEISQPDKNRSFQLSYLNHKTFNEVILPVEIMIEAKQEDKKTTISIVYNNAVFNEDLTFPYNVPDGSERINID